MDFCMKFREKLNIQMGFGFFSRKLPGQTMKNILKGKNSDIVLVIQSYFWKETEPKNLQHLQGNFLSSAKKNNSFFFKKGPYKTFTYSTKAYVLVLVTRESEREREIESMLYKFGLYKS